MEFLTDAQYALIGHRVKGGEVGLQESPGYFGVEASILLGQKMCGMCGAFLGGGGGYTGLMLTKSCLT